MALGQTYSIFKNDVIKGLPYLRKGFEIEGSQYLSLIYNSLGTSYLNIGDYERAEEYLQKSLELEVSCWVISNYSWLLAVQGKFQEDRQFTDSVCQQVDCDWTCNTRLFEVSLLLDEFERAEQYYYQWKKAGTGFGPLERSLDYQIGYVYYQLGRTEEAEKTFTEQIQKLQSSLDEDRRGTYYNLASIYAFQGDREKALKHQGQEPRAKS